ncbi:MAG: polysaccharide biosynthesis protein [Gammaproteobacteria bacterium]
MEKFRNYLITRTRSQKTLILTLSDAIVLNGIFVFSNFLYFFSYNKNSELFSSDLPFLNSLNLISFNNLLVISIFSILVIYVLDGYKSYFRSIPANSFIGKERIIGSFIFSLLSGISLSFYMPYSSTLEFLNFFFSLFMITVFYYVILRTFALFLLTGKQSKNSVPIIIYGAGQAGRETAAQLSQNKKYNILGFIDDDAKLKNFRILGFKVIGNLNKIVKFRKSYPELLVIMAMINISDAERKRIISLLEELEIHVKTIPSNYGALETKLSIENININDLINRDNALEENDLSELDIENKNILITGAGGSIGSEIASQVAMFKPKSLFLIDSSEYNLYKLEQNFKTYKGFENMSFILENVQNYQNLENIIEKNKIDFIYHAAAYKHVPLLQKQENFKVAIKNNFLATFNLCEIAKNNNVERLTLISTDKAVNPTNIMGASKRLAEISLQGFQNEKDNSTCFSIVRFGNVLNSSGSVVPLFWDQIYQGGPVTVTDKEINRFFMSIEEASGLVLLASSLAEGGEVFLLDMGNPIKIRELAEKMIRLSGNSVADQFNKNGIKIEYSGLRPGEKLYEELLLSNNPISTEHKKIKKGIEKNYPLRNIYQLKKDIEENLASENNESINNLIKNFVDGYKI